MGAGGEARLEGVVFPGHVADLLDPRQRGKVACPPDGILLPCLLAVLAGAGTFTAIARFGKDKRDPLRRSGEIAAIPGLSDMPAIGAASPRSVPWVASARPQPGSPQTRPSSGPRHE
jgi:hypothetical protein